MAATGRLPDIQVEFGLSFAFTAALASAMGIVTLLVQLPFGHLADRVSRVWMLRLGTLGANLGSIVQALAQSAYLRQSEALAALVQQQFTTRVGRENRGVKQAGFYVLWSASMPSVLIELGFVTNPQEAEFLRSGAGQDHLARAIVRAVRAFKADYERGLVAQ